MNQQGQLSYASQASNETITLYKDMFKEKNKPSRAPFTVLDFGSGERGAGRIHMDPLLHGMGANLDLYEPFDTVRPSCNPNTKQVEGSAVFGANRKEYDLVNISYVLCTMPPQQAQDVLSRLKEAQPNATYVIVDYILKHRTKNDLLSVLTTDSEKKWMTRSGVDAFCSMRGQHDIRTYATLFRESGFDDPPRAALLDDYPTRASFVLQDYDPAKSIESQGSYAEITHRMIRRVSALYAYAAGKCMQRVQDVGTLKEIASLTETIREKMDVFASGFGNDHIEKIYPQTLDRPDFLDTAISLERSVQDAISPSKKMRLPKLKAKWDVATLRKNSLQHQAY